MGAIIRSLAEGPADHVRFESDAAAAAATDRLAFPIQVTARKSGYAAAYAAVRDVIGQLEAETRQLRVSADARPVGVRFAFEDKGTVLVQVGCQLIVSLGGADQFWSRADTVARILDVIRRFCEPPKPDKEVAVYTGPAGPAPADTATTVAATPGG